MEDEPLVVRTGNRIEWHRLANGTVQTTPVFNSSFPARPIVSIPLIIFPDRDRWIVVSAGSRQINEVRMSFNGTSESCAIERSTYAGDQTAFLNGLGTIDPTWHQNDRLLIIDSDGFNVVNYTFGGSLTLFSNSQLGSQANRRFDPRHEDILEKDGQLLVLGNISHQVVSIDPVTQRSTPFAGTGVPVRSEASGVNRLDATFGY